VVHCQRVTPDRPVPGLVDDVREGLLLPPRSMPPKYFYDDTGSHLFDAICDTPEYYPTRTEDSLLVSHAAEIIATARPEHIVEFGSGTSRKTRHLLRACGTPHRCLTYWPFDVCEPMLLRSAYELMDQFDGLEVRPLLGDYHGGLAHMPRHEGVCLYLFLGGTIGNFQPHEARTFLTEIRACMGPGDWLLLGADRVKDAQVLHRAYNDAAGITAEFNLNLLRVLNRELDADFDLDGFRHEACYNRDAQQIEMYLVTHGAQAVEIAALGHRLELAGGEAILTEISRKYTVGDLEEMLAAAGLRAVRHYEPENGYFSLMLAGVD
jgi:L-histidine N-alpha-methyltransferase